MSDLFKPGEIDAPRGEYVEVGSRGGEVKKARVVTNTSGPLPPTGDENRRWKKVNKGNRRK